MPAPTTYQWIRFPTEAEAREAIDARNTLWKSSDGKEIWLKPQDVVAFGLTAQMREAIDAGAEFPHDPNKPAPKRPMPPLPDPPDLPLTRQAAEHGTSAKDLQAHVAGAPGVGDTPREDIPEATEEPSEATEWFKAGADDSAPEDEGKPGMPLTTTGANVAVMGGYTSKWRWFQVRDGEQLLWAIDNKPEMDRWATATWTGEHYEDREGEKLDSQPVFRSVVLPHEVVQTIAESGD